LRSGFVAAWPNFLIAGMSRRLGHENGELDHRPDRGPGRRLNQWADISHSGTSSRIVAHSVHSLRTGTPQTSHNTHITATVLDLGEFVLSGSSKSPRSGSSRPAMPAKRLFSPRRWCSCAFWRRPAFPVFADIAHARQCAVRTTFGAWSARAAVRGQHARRCAVSTRGGAWSARAEVCGQHARRCVVSTRGGVRSARAEVCGQPARRCESQQDRACEPRNADSSAMAKTRETASPARSSRKRRPTAARPPPPRVAAAPRSRRPAARPPFGHRRGTGTRQDRTDGR
jgi:hypothetical protein